MKPLFAYLIALGICVVIANLAKVGLSIPKSFAPLQFPTMFVGVTTGFWMSQLCFALLHRANWPIPMISALSMSLWVASIMLPLRIYEKRGTYASGRFDGVSIATVCVLATLHLTVTLCSLVNFALSTQKE